MHSNMVGYANDEAIANANLIAAAPDMLEALRAVFYVDAFTELPRAARDKVIAAIEKARDGK